MRYSISLEDKELGIIFLEKADASNGVAFGKLREKHPDTFEFIKNHCIKNNISFEYDESANFLSTECVPALQIIAEETGEVLGFPCYVEGIDEEINIVVLNIPHPLYYSLLST